MHSSKKVVLPPKHEFTMPGVHQYDIDWLNFIIVICSISPHVVIIILALLLTQYISYGPSDITFYNFLPSCIHT